MPLFYAEADQKKMQEGAESAIQQFRNLIADIKRPLLDGAVDENHILTELGTLSKLLEKYIRSGKPDENNLLSKELIAQFKRNGGFRYLDFHREAMDYFLHYLHLDVNIYPYTISPKATNIHVAQGIVPNK